ncbi:hypothetical protein FJZ36_06225 [Candidatus Poribacteria bacterium]|nr:hypothetical protein [Candidatus Poribacteria bacterium]
MPIKLLRRTTYFRLLDAARERDKLREEREAYEDSIRALQCQVDELRDALADAERSRADTEAGIPGLVERRVEERILEMSVSRRRFEQLAEDRAQLVELYIEKLTSLACRFALESVETQHNRGLLVLLVDARNMDPGHFSDFHEGQAEYLDHDEFRGIDRQPHIFSPNAYNVFEYMGGKELRLSDEGDVLGYEERDGALIVDLCGIIVRTRQMVEGVRSYKVYSKVERLMDGSARHSAAIYGSSLDEVLVAIAVSEETNHVTVFRDGRFVQAYDPHGDRIISRADYFGESSSEQPSRVLPMTPPRRHVANDLDVDLDAAES